MFVKSFLCVFVLTCTSALPNFVFIITDDQDLVLHSLEYMNKTVSLIGNEGVTLKNFFVNTPVCCPSRSSLLVGMYPHNSRVYNNSLSGGCSGAYWQDNHEINTFGSMLKKTKNYTTFYAGKYLNRYGDEAAGGVEHVPAGFDWWIGLKGNSVYYNYTLSLNGTGQFFENDYLTDKIAQYALDFLNEKTVIDNNFFLMLAPPAAHAPFTPAPRHSQLFADLQAVRTTPFNVTPVDKHWLVGMPPASLPDDVTYLDDMHRNRIRTLQAVDDLVESVVAKLQEVGVLDNTYVIFMSDNGFHIGQFTQPWDKREPYESDIHVPFLIRGPNIPKKNLVEYPVSAVDIFPTILDLAEIDLFDIPTDGSSFKNQLFNQTDDPYHKDFLIEYWGEGEARTVSSECPWEADKNELSECHPESWCKCQDSKNNTYSCLVTISNEQNFKYCSFIDGFMEAYNLIEDPYELHNIPLGKDEIAHYTRKLEEMKRPR